MKRRDLLRAAGAAAAFSFLPRGAESAWARVRSGHRPLTGLTPAQRSLVAGIADVILPRTDTPSATDVGVTDWVELIASEYYPDDVRSAFVAGLDAIDADVRAKKGRAFSELDPAGQTDVVAALDASPDRRSPAASSYARLKGLVIHGYFTSQRVEREVLHLRTAFPRFEGAADMPARPAR